MTIDVLQVSAPSLAYVCLGGFVVLFSMVSLLVKERMYISEVILGTGFGVVVGPYAANAFDPRAWGGTQENRITLEFMRIVLATGLFAAGVELPCAYMKHHAKSLLLMVVPTMAFGWVVVSALLHLLFPALDLVSALCIAACLTPTDPITCAAITRGKFAARHVPVDIRRILLAESAANDGLAYPFLSIAIYLTIETSTRVAIGEWFLIGCLYQVILGTILGAMLGSLFSYLMKFSHKKRFVDRESFVAQFLALSVFTVGVASTIGVDDLLASFAAGCAMSWDDHFNVQTADDSFSSVIDYVLNCGCFIYIGAWLPFQSYDSPELGITPWRLVVLMIAIIVLRRIPFLLLVYRRVPEITSWKEALFCGHFGPMGVSAIFVSALAVTRLPAPENPPGNQAQLLAAVIQPIVSFVVLSSIIIHGLSIPFFNLGREVQFHATTLASYTRRPENGTSTPTATDTGIDVEHGMPTSEKVGPDPTGNGLPPPANIMIHDTTVEETAVAISGRIPGGTAGSETTEPTQAAKGNSVGKILQFEPVRSPFTE